MNLIKKLISENETEITKKPLYNIKDIYFIIDYENKSIIPIVFNTEYTFILRLDKIEVCKQINSIDFNSFYAYQPNYLIPAGKNNYGYLSVNYKNKDYIINEPVVKFLFATKHKDMNFLNDIDILNSERLRIKYNLTKHKLFRTNLFSLKTPYASINDIQKLIHKITISKKFKIEIENFNNKQTCEVSRNF